MRPGAKVEVGPGLNPMGFDVHYYAILDIATSRHRDISRARADFDYAPRYDFAAGVRDYVARLS